MSQTGRWKHFCRLWLSYSSSKLLAKTLGPKKIPTLKEVKLSLLNGSWFYFLRTPNVSYQKALKGIILGGKGFSRLLMQLNRQYVRYHKIHLKYFTINIFSFSQYELIALFMVYFSGLHYTI